MALITFTLLISGCGIYSFQGGKLKPGLSSVSVEMFENKASIVVPTLAQDITEALKDKFISQSNLKLVAYDGDMNFTGQIQRYDVAPVAIQGNETAAQNRLTVALRVKYECEKYPEDNWENNFTQFVDFPSSQSLSDVESSLLSEIVNNLTQDIFNKVLSNW